MEYECIKSRFENLGIKSYYVQISSDILADAIWFLDYEEFEQFVVSKKIQDVFVFEQYPCVDSYIISDDTAREAGIDPRLVEILSDVIDPYNEEIEGLEFDYPENVFVILIWNGQKFIYLFQNEITIQGEPILDAEEKMLEFIQDNQARIMMDAEQDKINYDNELNSLKQSIVEDSKFKKCTNMRMRRNYAYSLFGEDCQYPYLKKRWVYGKGILSEAAIDFVEHLWREMKTSG